jgi:hypothetical protein
MLGKSPFSGWLFQGQANPIPTQGAGLHPRIRWLIAHALEEGPKDVFCFAVVTVKGDRTMQTTIYRKVAMIS